MRCQACGEEVPEGIFCTRCGADQTASGRQGDRRGRRGRFAASPDEHVSQPGVMTALFPHLDHDEVNEFRWALIAGVVVLLVLYAAGLITAALIVAAFLVPVLYVLYLYEVRVYRDAPATVLGLTIGGGLLLGVVVTLVGNALAGPLPFPSVTVGGTGLNLAPLIMTGLLIPVLQELVKPLPALLLRRRPEFGETIDGLVFGVAAGLGFALAQTLVQFSQVLTTLDLRTDPANWLYPLVSAALLWPLLHGSTTGAITAAVWRFGRQHRGRLEIGAVVAAVAAHVAFVLGSQLILAAGYTRPLVLVWQGIVVGAMIVYVRHLLHRALLDEAGSLGFARTTCPNCRRDVTAAGFCPTCGMAMSAVPDAIRRAREAIEQPTSASAG